MAKSGSRLIPCFVYITRLLPLFSYFGGFVSCEFYSYEPDIFSIAMINISYIDPATSQLKVESGEIGRYGLSKLEDMSGIVVHVTSNNHTSHTACHKIDMDRIPHEPYIALIKQGYCKDRVKLKHVAEANASGAVVYTYFFDTKLFKLRNEESSLPYVFISGQKGEEIAALLANGTRVMMSVEVSSSNGFRYASANRTSILFVSVSFVILMIVSMAWLVFYYVQRFRYVIAKDVLSRRLCSAAKTALDKIPVKTIKSKDCDKDDECCAICIEPLKPDEVIRILPCKHSFHKVCVDPWLLEKRSCPMCKLDILQYFGLIYSGSQESMVELDDNNMHRRRSSTVISDIIHVPTSRRNSSSQTMPLTQDRATSPCSFVCLLPGDDHERNSSNVVEVSIENNMSLPGTSHSQSSSKDSKPHTPNMEDDCDFDILLVNDTSDVESESGEATFGADKVPP